MSTTRGIRVEPPTRTTSSILSGVIPASLKALLHRFHRPLQQVFHQLLELRPGQLKLHVLRAGSVRRQERQVDLRFLQLRKLDLGLFSSFLEALNRHLVLADVDALIALELGRHPIDDALVDIVAAKVRVAVRRLHFDDAFADFEDRNIKRAAAQVVHGDRFVLLFVETVGKRRGRGFVDDAQHFKPCNFAGLLGRLPLAVVEVGGNRDHRLAHFFAEEIFRGGLQFLKNHRRDFRRAVHLALNLNAGVVVRALRHFVRDSLRLFDNFVVATAHKPLDRIHRVFWVRDGLPLGHLSHQALSRLRDRDYRRRRPRAFLIGNHHGFAALHDGYHGVGRAQVNTNNLAHGNPLLLDQTGSVLGNLGRRRVSYTLSVSLSSSLCVCMSLYMLVLYMYWRPGRLENRTALGDRPSRSPSCKPLSLMPHLNK